MLWRAIKSWSNAKAIALLATIAFAVGIGSTTAIYTVVNAVMLAPLPYADSDRFVAIYGARFSEPGQFSSHTLADAQEYQRRTTSFDAFGTYRLGEANLTAPGEPRHVSTVAVTRDLAHSLGAPPMLGRWFTDPTGAVISYRLWRRLGGDPAIVGRSMTLDGRPLTITGVMPPRFRLPVSGPGSEGYESDVWTELDPLGRDLSSRAAFYFVYARRKPGVTLTQADADVKRAAAAIGALDPPSHPSYTAKVQDLREGTVAGIRPTLLLLFAAAALLLLITCANVAGLLLARSVARARETATHVALGIPERRLAAQYLAEAFVVAVAGAVGGVAVSIALVRAAISIGSDFVPRADEIAPDWTVFAFALAMAVAASLLCGVAPLWQALRTRPTDVLNAGVRATAGARVRRLSQSLVVAEIALAFTLLAVSGALIVHLRALAATPPGFDPDRLTTVSIALPDAIASDDARRRSYETRLVDAIAAIPGVTSVGFASRMPLTGCCLSTTIYREGHPVESRAVERTSYVVANASYFATMRIPLRRGRAFTDADASENPVHVVLNEAAAARYWGADDPVGGFGRFGGADGNRFQIVGVVGNVRNNGLGAPTVPEIYLPNLVASANPLAFAVRSSLSSDALVAGVRRAIRGVDPALPLHDASTMRDVVARSLALERVGSLMTTFFALAALLMATLAIYGLVAYSVRQRRVEIGTRMALGAASRDVLALVVGGGLKLTAIGVAIGVAGVVGALSLLARFLNLRDAGVMPFALSAVATGGIAAAASWVPAWRASRLPPMIAIRDDAESVWTSARARLRQAIDRFTRDDADAASAIETMLIADFSSAARLASAPAEQLRIALAAIRSRVGADAVWLLEPIAGGYRSTAADPDSSASCAVATDGHVVSRLARHSGALPFAGAELDALARWAAEQRPARLAELEMLRARRVRLAVALRTRNEIVGVLLLAARSDGREYGAVDKAVVSACAVPFAFMIENARLTARVVEQEKVRRDLALAAEVQRRLLPERPPQVTAAALAAMSVPARSIGGDYFDFIDAGDQRVAIALADVSGKGIAAALIMSAVHAALRILGAENGLSLPQLAEKMNRFLYDTTGSKSYATFFYARVEECGRRLRYVNAGHLPPYLLRASSDAIQELTVGGAVIGLFPQMAYEEATVALQPGDVLVAFTDGVTEALNGREEEFGEERLKALLRDVVHLPAQEIAARIFSAMQAWIHGAPQYDDLTFVVMKVN